LETHNEAYKEKSEEKNAIQELFNKINEILEPDHGRIRNIAHKMHGNESNPYHKHSTSHYSDYTGRVHQSDESRALLNNNCCRMCENINNDDDIPRINYVPITEDPIHEVF
jgi:hypothetical protein